MANFMNINDANKTGELYMNLDQVLFIAVDWHRGEQILTINPNTKGEITLKEPEQISKIKSLLNLG